MQRQVDLISTWLNSPASRTEPWTEAAFNTDAWLRLSPAELADLGRDLQAVIDRYYGRTESPAREPVFLLARAFDLPPRSGAAPGPQSPNTVELSS